MKRLHYRQGDVLLLHIDGLPLDSVPESNIGRIILALGEATGHAHALSTAHALAFQSESGRFVKLEKPTDLVHEEHESITLPSGVYRVVRQREYLPSARNYSYVDD